jgi:hypothetical protein
MPDRLCGLVVRVPGYRSRGPGLYSRRDQIFWEVVGLEVERNPLSLMSLTEELLGRNGSGSGLENREYGRGDALCWPRDTLYPQKLALTSTTSGGRSVGIVRLRTKTTEFVLVFVNSQLPGQKLICNLKTVNAWMWKTLARHLTLYGSKKLGEREFESR